MSTIKINLTEIDEKGSVCSSAEHEFNVVPRIGERILLANSTDHSKIYKVLDIHHTPGEIPTIFIMSDYLTVRNVMQNIANTMT